MLVNAKDWKHAKGIAVDKWGKEYVDKKNTFVEEVIIEGYGKVCSTDSIETQHVVVQNKIKHNI